MEDFKLFSNFKTSIIQLSFNRIKKISDAIDEI